MTEQCDVCRFYSRWTEHSGVCRRYAPRPAEEAKDTSWPVVLEYDWCGEFQPKPDPDELMR